LIVLENGNKRIDEIKGYTDTGKGCNSHLFEDENKFILIECNGTIYNIQNNGGKIEKEVWSWMNELPKNYVWTFERQKGKDEYKLVKNDYPNKEDVHKTKDTND